MTAKMAGSLSAWVSNFYVIPDRIMCQSICLKSFAAFLG